MKGSVIANRPGNQRQHRQHSGQRRQPRSTPRSRPPRSHRPPRVPEQPSAERRGKQNSIRPQQHRAAHRRRQRRHRTHHAPPRPQAPRHPRQRPHRQRHAENRQALRQARHRVHRCEWAEHSQQQHRPPSPPRNFRPRKVPQKPAPGQIGQCLDHQRGAQMVPAKDREDHAEKKRITRQPHQRGIDRAAPEKPVHPVLKPVARQLRIHRGVIVARKRHPQKNHPIRESRSQDRRN